MVEELGNLLDNFPGAANQTRCFTHILNLVVKSILAQFDLPKARVNIADEMLELADGLELDEAEEENSEGEDEVEDDNVEGWIDEREVMSEEQLEELEAGIRPIRVLLIKVSNQSSRSRDTHCWHTQASQIGLRNQELHYPRPSKMVFHSPRSEPQRAHDAS